MERSFHIGTEIEERNFNGVIKRIFDIVLTLPLLLIFALVFPVLAFCVCYKSKGSIFYTQQRYGQYKKPFRIYKLRTLHQNLCDDGEHQVIYNDARITPAGKWLRRYSLDELPQLYNVLIGDMSLVGPRPHAVKMDDYYQGYIAHYNNRYAVKPGITGLAQIKGHRGETKLMSDMEVRIGFDREYIRKHSFGLDCLILLKTINAVLFPSA